MVTLVLLLALPLQVAGGVASQGASISGRVTDKASGQPLRRMLVTLIPADRTKAVEMLTDIEGRYSFTVLAAGRYAVVVDNDEHHATYLRQWFGSDEPANRSAIPAPNIEVARGESRGDVDIAISRALAIAGRVLDPLGEPQGGAEVTVTDPDGRTVGVRRSISDDLGAYRVFGLGPGRYRVCAEVPTSALGTPLARTCYPVIPLLSQDANNIDIQTELPAGPSEAAGRAVTTTETTGTIRGLVTDKQSGRPLRHATVHLGYHGSAPRPMTLSAVTDEDGVFTLFGLAPGQYDGFATTAGYLLTRLLDLSNATSLTVQPRQVLHVSASLARAYAINVRLVDEFDAPVSNVGLAVRFAGDARSITSPFANTTVQPVDDGQSVAILSFHNSSDDLGHVRVSGLRPGRYVVCAEAADLAAASPRPAQRRNRDRLLRTCYPSTPAEAESLPITIGDADIDLELRLVRGRAFSVSGTIIDASGSPAPRAVTEFSKYLPGGQTSAGFEVRPDGHFEITNVQPGAYAIEATTDRETAFVPVRIEDEDIENLTVAMRKTTTVEGRIVMDDPSTTFASASDRAPLEVSARLVDERLPGEGSSRDATANSDGTFVLEGLFGSRRIDVQNVPHGWYAKAIRYGTKDITDQPTEFRDDRGPLEIVLSNRGATLSGTVADVIEKRAPRARVFLFRAPASQDDSPRLAGSVLSVTGNYEFGPLRHGDYFIVAVPSEVPTPRPGEGDVSARLAAAGERVTVTELEERRVDLHVVTVR